LSDNPGEKTTCPKYPHNAFWIAKIQLAGLINSLEFIEVFLPEKLTKRTKKRLTNQNCLYIMRTTSTEEVTVPP
jgi:hypothetical protein